MSEIQSTNRSLAHWLFNPFQFIAGLQALLIGLLIILLSAFIGSLSNTHFDGVLDVHTGAAAPWWVFPAEGIIDWLCLAVPLFLFGLIFSPTSFRAIDVFGTQALARWPLVFAAVAMLPSANQRVGQYLQSKLVPASAAVMPSSLDWAIFAIAIIITILAIIWMVALMYRAYAVSCNLKGPKAVVTFIIGLIGGEIFSKVVLYILISRV